MEGGKNDSNIKLKMDKQTILKGLQHAHENFYRPIFIHSKYGDDLINYKEFEAYRILHIVPAKVYEESKKMYKDVLPVFTLDDINDMAIKSREIENIIFNISEKDINKLYDCILKLWKIADRINLNIIDLNGKFELDVYKKQLQKIKDIIVMGVHNNSFNKELNVLTDILFINQHNNCGAGDKAVTLGPDGKFYVCPAFYGDKTEKDIGNLENGIDEFPNKQLYTQKFAPVCNCCDAYHCVDCVYHNKKYTTEVHIPASSQCQKSWVEKNVSAQIVKECQDIATYFNAVKESDEIDPINILRRELAHENIGYYTTK
jgi:radical SAM domain protein